MIIGILENDIQKIFLTDQEGLLAPKNKNVEMNKFEWSFLTTFSEHHFSVKMLLKKHLNISVARF